MNSCSMKAAPNPPAASMKIPCAGNRSTHTAAGIDINTVPRLPIDRIRPIVASPMPSVR